MIWSKILGNINILIKVLGGVAILILALLAKCNSDEADMYLKRIDEVRELHTKEVNSNGDTIYITKMEYYTKDNIKDSKDPVILDLLNQFNNLKLREIENLTKTNAHTNIKYITNTIRDTVVLYNNDSINASEYESFNNGILSIQRIKDVNNVDSSYYKYDYKPTIYSAVSWHKEGRWRIHNIWKWRPKIWTIDMSSNDTNMVFENTKFVYIGKNKD